MNAADYMRNRRKARRAKWIALLGGECIDCGETDANLLQFDHKHPKRKEHDLNSIKDGNEEIVLKELSKCVLRCAPCHLKKTKDKNEHINRDKSPSTHGSIWHYKSRKCRCPKCRRAMRLYYFKSKSKKAL